MSNYETEARSHWDATDAYREHEQKTKNYTKEKWAEANDGLMAIFAEFAACNDSGASADSAEVMVSARAAKIPAIAPIRETKSLPLALFTAACIFAVSFELPENFPCLCRKLYHILHITANATKLGPTLDCPHYSLTAQPFLYSVSRNAFAVSQFAV